MFAGRVGGNQTFVASGDTAQDELLMEQTPDAVPLTRLKDVFALRGVFEPVIWRAAVIECWGNVIHLNAEEILGTSLTPQKVLP